MTGCHQPGCANRGQKDPSHGGLAAGIALCAAHCNAWNCAHHPKCRVCGTPVATPAAHTCAAHHCTGLPPCVVHCAAGCGVARQAAPCMHCAAHCPGCANHCATVGCNTAPVVGCAGMCAVHCPGCAHHCSTVPCDERPNAHVMGCAKCEEHCQDRRCLLHAMSRRVDVVFHRTGILQEERYRHWVSHALRRHNILPYMEDTKWCQVDCVGLRDRLCKIAGNNPNWLAIYTTAQYCDKTGVLRPITTHYEYNLVPSDSYRNVVGEVKTSLHFESLAHAMAQCLRYTLLLRHLAITDTMLFAVIYMENLMKPIVNTDVVNLVPPAANTALPPNAHAVFAPSAQFPGDVTNQAAAGATCPFDQMFDDICGLLAAGPVAHTTITWPNITAVGYAVPNTGLEMLVMSQNVFTSGGGAHTAYNLPKAIRFIGQIALLLAVCRTLRIAAALVKDHQESE